MKYSDLRLRVKTMTNRPELDDLQTGETLTRVQTALEAAHLSLQQDELVDNSFGSPVRMIPDWQAQVYKVGTVASPVIYPSGSFGILTATLPATNCTLKRITDVDQIRLTGTTHAFTPIDPATQIEIEYFEQTEKTEFGNLRLSRGLYHQRWWVDDGKLKLLFNTQASGADFNLHIRLLQILPFYVNADDSDYFSEELWQTLVFGAAYYCFMFIGETEDAGNYKTLFEEAAVKALRADKRNAKGGLAQIRRPPLATGRKY